MKNFKKIVLIFAAFIMAVVAPLVAASMTVTWEWLLDDDEVTAYRYQVGGEEEDGWTLLDADVSELTLENLDPASGYTLYLQRSYDGVNWSESASSTAEAIIIEIPEGIETGTAFDAAQAEAEAQAAAEAAAIAAAEAQAQAEAAEAQAQAEAEAQAAAEAAAEAEAQAQAEAAAEESAQEAVSEAEETVAEESAEEEAEEIVIVPAKAKATDNFEFSLLFNFGVSLSDIDLVRATAFMPARFGLGFEFKDIVSNDVAGLTLRLNLGTQFIPTEGWGDSSLDGADYFDVTKYDSMFTVDAMVLANFTGNTDIVNFYVGGGVGYAVSPNGDDDDSKIHQLLDLNDFDFTDSSFKLASDWYATGLAGIRVELGEVFSIGAEAAYRYYVGSDKHALSGDLVLGFSF